MECYSAIRRAQALTQATTWMNLEMLCWVKEAGRKRPHNVRLCFCDASRTGKSLAVNSGWAGGGRAWVRSPAVVEAAPWLCRVLEWQPTDPDAVMIPAVSLKCLSCWKTMFHVAQNDVSKEMTSISHQINKKRFVILPFKQVCSHSVGSQKLEYLC